MGQTDKCPHCKQGIVKVGKKWGVPLSKGYDFNCATSLSGEHEEWGPSRGPI